MLSFILTDAAYPALTSPQSSCCFLGHSILSDVSHRLVGAGQHFLMDRRELVEPGRGRDEEVYYVGIGEAF